MHAGPRATPTTTTARCCGSTRSSRLPTARSRPWAGTTYSLPTATSPNGPNLFNGTETEGGEAARPSPRSTRWACATRARLSIDPGDRRPVHGVGRPRRAAARRATRGPSTYESAAQITHAGNYGWPYCMGNKQAYRDRASARQPRTTNGARATSRGGPATARYRRLVRLRQHRNDSPNNTGLTVFRTTPGTGADAGTAPAATTSGGAVASAGEQRQRLPGVPASRTAAGRSGAPNYGAARRTSSRAARTSPTRAPPSMNGPVYRYNDTATTTRAAGRVLGRPLVPATTAALERQARVAARSRPRPAPPTACRSTPTAAVAPCRGARSYMDSKFGPDGALYVQIYDGFFRAGQAVGIYRYEYTGCPTPGANPRGFPIGATGRPLLQRRLRRHRLGVGLRRRLGQEQRGQPDARVPRCEAASRPR